MRVVLVGNKLIESNQGELIDSYDLVIRLNGGIVTLKNKHHIGTKTDCWSFSTKSKAQYDGWHESFRGVTKLTLNNRCNYEFVEGFRVEHPAYDELTAEYAHSRPSTGLITADYLVRVQGFDVDLVGFDFFSSGTWYRGSNENIPHDGDNERDYLTGLVGNIL